MHGGAILSEAVGWPGHPVPDCWVLRDQAAEGVIATTRRFV